jgi:beta-galactosidase/beta-glucuronidase
VRAYALVGRRHARTTPLDFLGGRQLSSIPRPEYPRPQLVRNDWLNLNGEWEFGEDPGLSGEARGLPTGGDLERKIVVPFAPESKLSGVGKTDFMPCVWYRRRFRVPDHWGHSRLLLHFGAVDYEATVWVNGRLAGMHRGGYTPFRLDITALVDREGDNTLVVRAIDDTRSGLQPTGKQSVAYASARCHYTRTTGIWQTVWLEPVPAFSIDHLRLTPSLTEESIRVEAVLYSPVPGVGPSQGRLRAAVRADGEVISEHSVEAVAPLTTMTLDVAKPRLWSPANPFLYDLELVLETEAGMDRVVSYFGMRSIKLADGCVYLNGEPLFQRLVLDQGFYPDGIYTAPSDAHLRRDIELAQAAGFNGARLHEKVFEPRFLTWADRLGYLVWGEFPNWGLNHSDSAVLESVLTEWLEVLQRDANHPSIITWCPFNETPNDQNPELLRTIYRVTKAVDPTRPVVDTSGYVHVSTDLYTVHNYSQDVAQFAAAYGPLAQGEAGWRNSQSNNAPHVAGQPYLVDEYGGIWWNPAQIDEKAWGYGARPLDEEEFFQRLGGLTSALVGNPRICGFCYTQLTDVEQEVNGLYTDERLAKFDPACYKAIFAAPAAIETQLRTG